MIFPQMLLNRLALGPREGELLSVIFAAPYAYGSVEEVFLAVNVKLKTARWRLRKKQLPSPKEWFQLARALCVVGSIQGSSKTLAKVASGFGYASHSGVSKLIVRTFGLTPSLVRFHAGNEWLLERWLERAGLAMPSRKKAA